MATGSRDHDLQPDLANIVSQAAASGAKVIDAPPGLTITAQGGESRTGGLGPVRPAGA